MTLRARSCAAALVFVGLALYTESAHAEAAAGARAAPYCAVTLASSKAGVALPANAPALLITDASYDTSAPTVQAALVGIASGTRTDLAATTDAHGLWTLPLPSPGAAAGGAYDVEVTTSCPEMSEPQSFVTPLTLSAPVPFPTSVGTLVHTKADPPTGFDNVRLEPTPNMTAFLPAARLQLLVDGAKSATSRFVSATSSAIELSVHTGDACIENGALHREKRIVKVTVEGPIAGLAESPAAATIDVPIDCGAIKWTSELDLDGDPKTPAGSNATPSSSTQSSDSGSCSASPVGTHDSGPGLFAFAVGGLGLVAMRRRRRR